MKLVENRVASERELRQYPEIMELVEVDQNGRLWLCSPSFDNGQRVQALWAVNDGAMLPSLPCKVVVQFEGGRPELPVITGIVRDRIPRSIYEAPANNATLNKAVVDGETVVIEGQKNVVLKCGKSSITLNRDGKIVIKGERLHSRASAANKIKGASVNIN